MTPYVSLSGRATHRPPAAACPRRPLPWLAGLALTALFCTTAVALDLGPLKLGPPTGPTVSAEIVLSDRVVLDAAAIRARVATREAYGVAGLTFHPALDRLQLSVKPGPQGRALLQIDRLPLDAGVLDLLLTVNDRASLSLAEYRIDLRGSTREFPSAPAGTWLAARQSGGTTTAPVAPVAPAVNAKTTPAPAPSAPAPAVDELESARAAIQAWAQAWSRRDVDAYVAAYVPGYAGRAKQGSRAAWVEERRARILGRRSIEVEVVDLRLVREPGRIVARFEQRYRGDELAASVQKQIVLVEVGGRWLIQRETEKS